MVYRLRAILIYNTIDGYNEAKSQVDIQLARADVVNSLNTGLVNEEKSERTFTDGYQGQSGKVEFNGLFSTLDGYNSVWTQLNTLIARADCISLVDEKSYIDKHLCYNGEIPVQTCVLDGKVVK